MQSAGKWSASPLGDYPDPHSIMSRAASEGEWLVPVEIVLACTTSAMRAVVTARRAKGDRPQRSARVIARGDRYFATIFFGPNRSDLFLPLDCWAWEEWS